MPSWLPRDLPLPKGTYESQNLPNNGGYSQGIFVVPGDLSTIARFVLAEWPNSGWVLGRGDSEPGEVESQFSRGPEVGAFRARAVYCDPGFSLMLIIYAPTAPPSPPTSPSVSSS
jgi:hypothetical protein